MCLKILRKIDWHTTANIATTIALLVTIIALISNLRENRKTNEFVIFSKYQEAYTKVSENISNTWSMIKKEVRSNPKTKNEIPDISNSFDYIKLRIKQPENLYGIELHLIENEIQSLNILNQICQYALKDERKLNLVKIMYSKDISFYQDHIEDLLNFRKYCSRGMLLPIPRYNAIKQIKVDEHFGR